MESMERRSAIYNFSVISFTMVCTNLCVCQFKFVVVFQGTSGIAGPPGDRGNPGQRVSHVEYCHGLSCGIYSK